MQRQNSYREKAQRAQKSGKSQANSAVIWIELRLYFLLSNSADAAFITSEATLFMPHTVLVLDDEDAVLEAIEIMLRHHGYSVLLARTEAEAYELWSTAPEPVFALLADVHVSKPRSGMELAQRIRSQDPGSNVVLMSGYPTGLLQESFSDGKCIFLQKPFTAQMLVRVLESLPPRPAPEQAHC